VNVPLVVPVSVFCVCSWEVVAKVPDVGRVTLVVPLKVRVRPYAPEKVMVFAALFALPVPPLSAAITVPFHVPVAMVPRV
jgi:hypothetical protein